MICADIFSKNIRLSVYASEEWKKPKGEKQNKTSFSEICGLGRKNYEDFEQLDL